MWSLQRPTKLANMVYDLECLVCFVVVQGLFSVWTLSRIHCKETMSPAYRCLRALSSIYGDVSAGHGHIPKIRSDHGCSGLGWGLRQVTVPITSAYIRPWRFIQHHPLLRRACVISRRLCTKDARRSMQGDKVDSEQISYLYHLRRGSVKDEAERNIRRTV